jgi:hypothetical protein
MIISFLEQKEDIESKSKPTPSKSSALAESNEMTLPKIAQICRSRKDLYDTPDLNDVLYLHYQNFNKIQVCIHSTINRIV